MPGIFDNLSDFFFGIFSGDVEARKLRKDLRDINEFLQTCRPPIFQKKDQRVLGNLGSSFLNLYRLTLPLFDVFSKTINNPDKKIQELSQVYLLESILLGDIQTRKLQFTYEAMKERFLNSNSPNQEQSRINNDYNNLLNDIRKQDANEINLEVSSVYKLRDMVTHNYFGFFKKFGVDLGLIGNGNPKFESVDGDNILPEILDLYFVLDSVSVTPSMLKGLGVLLERISASKAQENIKKMEKLLNRVDTMLRGPCSPKMLMALMRAIRQEPLFVPDSSKKQTDFFQKYIEDFNSRFNNDRDRASREVSENSINRDLGVLFPDGHLLDLSFYNASRNELLINLGFPSLSCIKPMQILKSYFESVFKTYIQDQMKQLLTNAFFQDKEFGTRLGTAFYTVEKLGDRLNAWDGSLGDEGKNTFHSLEKHIKAKSSVQSIPHRIIENINKSATEFMENELKDLVYLTGKISEILADYKNPQPKNINNIKGLGGKYNQSIIQGLVTGYNKTVQCLKIMKHFVVVRGLGPGDSSNA